MEMPRQKKLTDVDPLTGMLGGLRAIGAVLLSPGDNEARRANALTDKFNDITVDTCLCLDTGLWETGVERMKVEGKWVIVSQYESKEEAKEEHQKWVVYLKENPECELKDINKWNFPDREEEANGLG